MFSLFKRVKSSPLIIYLLLSSLLTVLISPIIYYGYRYYTIRGELNNIEDPNSLVANRYIHAGDWPASRDDSRIITEADKFKVAKVIKSEGSELNEK
ncbi:MAG: hypothetical protein ACJAT7_003035 [Psychromonas sp.]|jgi:hypothetical protein|uniref:hypothetical protein n=1 Tax=Psychromonas sp. TaxID=1884585 RepID=UPI0039E2A7EE